MTGTANIDKENKSEDRQGVDVSILDQKFWKTIAQALTIFVKILVIEFS